MYLVAGGYLSFFFMISHNFVGAQALTDTTRPSNKGCDKNSFLYKQVRQIINMFLVMTLPNDYDKQCATSSNLAGWWLCQLNGGLNYQIEHHLFPGMNHCHYPTIAPIVRYVCKKFRSLDQRNLLAVTYIQAILQGEEHSIHALSVSDGQLDEHGVSSL